MNTKARILVNGDMQISGELIEGAGVNFSEDGVSSNEFIEGNITNTNPLSMKDGKVIIKGELEEGFSFSSATQSNSVIQDGLLLDYNFRGKSNLDVLRTVVQDSSVNGFDGALNNFSFNTSSGYGEALLFDGIDDTVTSVGNISMDSYIASSYEIYVKPKSFNVKDGGVYGAAISNLTHSSNPRKGISIAPNKNGIYIEYSNNGTLKDLVIPATGIDLNVWSHIVITYDGVTMKAYLNSKLIWHGLIQFIQNNQKIIIGRWALDYSQYFYSGEIASIKVYNKALSEKEILQNYEVETGGY